MRLISSLIIITYLAFQVSRPARALYDPRTVAGNQIGVHILSPSELDLASALVNSQGGDWGYVTIPIQPTDRDPVKWQAFLDNCRALHLIPLIRITTIPQGGTWGSADPTDLVDFANFLAALNWPTGNRYIILFNEVNRQEEWGGKVDPASYADILKNAHKIFKERSADFFLLGPSLDSALPSSKSSLSASAYIRGMQAHDQAVFSYLDGWSSHSYPNPAFRSSPGRRGLGSIASYQAELGLAGSTQLPVFITETGWDTSLPSATLASNWQKALTFWQNDPRVVAVTPFILEGGDQYRALSLLAKDGTPTPSYEALYAFPKKPGTPGSELATGNLPLSASTPYTTDNTSPVHKIPDFVIKIENFLRRLFGLMPRASLYVGEQVLSVEVADNAALWTKGLSGRTHLDPGAGMLFIFPSSHIPSFWMKEMQFDLDIIWISHGKVVEITRAVPHPDSSSQSLPTYSPSVPVDWVLEVPSGYAAQINLQIGSQVTLEP